VVFLFFSGSVAAPARVRNKRAFRIDVRLTLKKEI